MTYERKDLIDGFNYLLTKLVNDSDHKKELVLTSLIDDRYKNILPYKFNYPKLSNGKYINASWINLPYKENIIATQGPKLETINNFYQMIFDYDCNVIIMLCKWEEDNRKKCYDYLNINNLNLNFIIENIEIKMEIKDYLIVKKLFILNKETNEKKEIYHINFLYWKDHSVPDIQTSIEIFEKIFYLICIKRNNKPLIVHCSAGVGRTGTFIAIYLLIDQIFHQPGNDIYNNNIIEFNIFNLVRQLKEMRLKLIENVEQYIFVHDYIKYCLENYKLFLKH